MIILIMIIMLVSPQVFKKIIVFNNDSTATDQDKLDSLVAFFEKNQILIEKSPSGLQPYPIILSGFNPNIIDYEGLLSLGIDEKLAKRVINYRNKGGQFRIKSDFKKMYGLSAKKYLSLYPYIELPETKGLIVKSKFSFNKEKGSVFPNTKYTKVVFDINKTDTSQLQSLYGIGSKLALRIISFRNKLGGFVNEEQYAEIYGLDTSVVKLLKERSNIEERFTPEKININTATFETLKEHPYIKFKIAKLIIAYRQQHGNFSSVEDIKKIKPISDTEFIKLIHYVKI